MIRSYKSNIYAAHNHKVRIFHPPSLPVFNMPLITCGHSFILVRKKSPYMSKVLNKYQRSRPLINQRAPQSSQCCSQVGACVLVELKS